MMQTRMFHEDTQAGVGGISPRTEMRDAGLCACGCGQVVVWRGYGRKPEYVSKAHGERARRARRKVDVIVIPNDVSRQTVNNMLRYMLKQVGDGNARDGYALEIAAMEYIVESQAPVEDTLRALKTVLEWVGGAR